MAGDLGDGRPIHVLRVITRARPGGSQQNLLNHLGASWEGVTLSLATGEEGFLTDAARRLGVRVAVLPNLVRAIHPLKDPAALRDLLGLIRSWRPEVVHTHTSKAGFLGRLAARAAGVPAVFTAHGWPFGEGLHPARERVYESFERLAARWCERVIAVCRADYQTALDRRIVPAGRLALVPNGIPDRGPRAEPGGGREARVVMVARLAPPKDPELLVRAAAGVRRPLRLVFVGDGPLLEGVRRLAGELPFPHGIEFLGERADVPQILASAHVCALASRREGMPLSILEAMRAGLPVVATAVGGVREQVRDGETGYLVPAGDVGRFRDRLQELVGDASRRVAMGAAGRRVFLETFSLRRAVEGTREVYRAVLCRKS